MADRYDWVVIGGGPAGEKGAAQAAYFGKRVALIDRGEHLGGACVNTGTLPSKTLRETCLHLSGYEQRGLGGIGDALRTLQPKDLLSRAHAVMESERERMRSNLGRHGVDILAGQARFVEPHAVEVAGPDGATRVVGDKFLLAVGSSPQHPDGIAFEHPLIDDSDEILTLEVVPRSLLVVGAGVIGCEYATMFAALGVKVVLADGRDALLPFLDREMADRLGHVMALGLGIDVRLQTKVVAMVGREDHVETKLSDGSTIRTDRALVAAGRTGNTEGLGLHAIGVTPDSRGIIPVDAQYRTAATHVYAVGDVIGFPSLASVSMEQARVATVHAFDLGYKQRVHALLPYGIYTIPELSMIGETEESAKKAGIEYETGRASYASNARGKIMGDATGLVKLVFRRDDKVLLGAHVIGENAAELVHLASAVLHFEGTIDTFIEMVFNYPTLSETFKYAAYDGLGRLAGRPGPSSVTQIGT